MDCLLLSEEIHLEINMSVGTQIIKNSSLKLLLLLVSIMVGFSLAPPSVRAATELFFSEYIEGSSNNKALEIYNGTGSAVDLAAGGYNVQMYFNGNPSAGLTINLSGTIADGDVFVLAHSSANPAILAQADQTNGAGWFNGDDAVVLRRGTTIIDVIGQIGFDPGIEWGSGLTSTADNTLRRKSGIEAGDPNGSDPFDPSLEWDGFATDTFDGLGSHSVTPSPNAPVIVSCGAPLSVLEGFSASRSISASDSDGVVVSMAIDAITPSDPGTITLSGFVPAPGVGGMATAFVDVGVSTPPGTYSVEIGAANNDLTPQIGTCTLTVTVQQVLPIGVVQGVVNDSDDGLKHRSSFAPPSGNSAGATVVVRGVIYQKTLARTSAGGSQNGFFIQNTAAIADGDPRSSDGIFVFMGGFSDLIGGYVPAVGDEVVISGRVTEFFNLTELSSARLLHLVRSGVDLEAELPAFEVNPPDDLADANRYWERHEGMRARVPAGSLVIDSRDVFASTADGEVWVMRDDHPVALRADPYTRRAFRDPHPLDNIDANQLFDDGNGYRIVLGSHGIKAAVGDNTALIAPARTYDVINNALIGGVYFSFSKYQIMIGQQLDLTPGVDPALNAPPQVLDPDEEFSLATFNLENLYDFRDDPFDGCDFTGNPGCAGVNPPFDYVPSSEAAYQARLNEIAQQIVADLHSPDIILVQEAEDQDICMVAEWVLTCGTADNADGKPDTLQELATVIHSLGGPPYDAAYDRDGADDRGIVAAYLFRADRVELLPALADDPVLGSAPMVNYRGAPLLYNIDVQNPKALNAELPVDVDLSTGVDGTNVFTRAPQVGFFRVWRNGIEASVFTDLYILDNHFSSTPNARVGQRTEQTAYNAAIVAALQEADPEVRVVVGGDLNVYPRLDDPFTPGHPLFPSDQLAPLYNQGLVNLFDILLMEVPTSAYGYIFQGQTQTLDQIFVTPSMLTDLVQVRVAHINSDFPAEYAGDGPRGTSDHDPLVAQFIALPTLDKMEDLVMFFTDRGDITGNNTTKILLNRLARARRFFESGQMDAYRGQLQAFIDQVQDFTPQFITPFAGQTLSEEMLLRLSLP